MAQDELLFFQVSHWCRILSQAAVHGCHCRGNGTSGRQLLGWDGKRGCGPSLVFERPWSNDTVNLCDMDLCWSRYFMIFLPMTELEAPATLQLYPSDLCFTLSPLVKSGICRTSLGSWPTFCSLPGEPSVATLQWLEIQTDSDQKSDWVRFSLRSCRSFHWTPFHSTLFVSFCCFPFCIISILGLPLQGFVL